MDKLGTWIRLRDEGGRVTLTYKQELATKTVLEQAGLMCKEWDGGPNGGHNNE